MIRLFDFLFSFFGILFLLPVMLVLYTIGIFDTGSPLFKQERVGKNKKPFTLYKFRTMNVKASSHPFSRRIANYEIWWVFKKV